MSDSGFAALDHAAFPEFRPGTVWLAGAGPGAPGLLTLLAYHALQKADVVIYDALVSEQCLAWARPGAQQVYAGKRGGKPSHNQRDISDRMVEFAKAGHRVLRLKGGDPFVFGRGGEECQALVRANIPFRVVPGISAGIGGLAYAGLPVTHRDTNHSVVFLTGHDSSGAVPASVDWHAIANASPVLVMYMAIKNLPEIAAKLISGGRAPCESVVIVSDATLANQRVIRSSLSAVSELARSGQLTAPSIVVVGAIGDFQNDLNWYVETLRANSIG